MRPPIAQEARGVEEAVAEIGLGADGHADDGAGRGDALELRRRGVGRVHQAPVLDRRGRCRAAARSGRRPVCSQAGLDLFQLLGDMDVHRQLRASMRVQGRARPRARSRAARRARNVKGGAGALARRDAGARIRAPAPRRRAETIRLERKSRLLRLQRLRAEVARSGTASAGTSSAMPAAVAAAPHRLPKLVRARIRRRRRVGDAGSEIRRPRCSPTFSISTNSCVASSSRSSGVIRFARAYMARRQVQKLSSGGEPILGVAGHARAETRGCGHWPSRARRSRRRRSSSASGAPIGSAAARDSMPADVALLIDRHPNVAQPALLAEAPTPSGKAVACYLPIPV